MLVVSLVVRIFVLVPAESNNLVRIGVLVQPQNQPQLVRICVLVPLGYSGVLTKDNCIMLCFCSDTTATLMLMQQKSCVELVGEHQHRLANQCSYFHAYIKG